MSEGQRLPHWAVGEWLNCDGPLTLDGLRGRVVVVHAFQMLCPACVRHALPQAERLHRQFAGDDLIVVGLHTVFEHHDAMRPAALRAFMHEYRITHPVGIDRHAPGLAIPVTMQRWQLRGTPSLIVLDRAGRVQSHHFGVYDDLPLGVLLGRLLEASAERTSGKGCDDVAGCPVPG
ncbi:MAG: redoxin domain-containing protein [Wenzhouxiangellaceae bacterium]